MKTPKASRLSLLLVLSSFIIISCSTQRATKTSGSANSAAKKGSEIDLSFLDKTFESHVDSSGNLVIADPVLKTKIEQSLGIVAGGKIPLSAVEAVTTLELGIPYDTPGDQKIRNIDALAYFKNLSSLNIDFNLASNISPLRNLKNLTELRAKNNGIRDISALKELKQLERLDLYANQVYDISILAELNQLIELNLWSNGVQNIEALKEFTKLKSLNLGGNFIKDISPLKNCKMLRTLWLNSNPLNNPNVISEIGENLVTLSIANCNLADIKFLENCTKLQSLMMFGNQVKDISALRNCQSLNTVFASANQIENIDVLAVLAEKGAFQKLSSYQDPASKTRINIDISNNRIDYKLEKNQKIRAFLNAKASGVKF